MRVVTFDYNDEQVEITPDFGLIERIEARFSLLDFLRNIESMRPKLSEVAWVLYCALAHAGRREKYKEVGQYVVENLAECNIAAMDIASTALSGGPEKASKKK